MVSYYFLSFSRDDYSEFFFENIFHICTDWRWLLFDLIKVVLHSIKVALIFIKRRLL